MSKPLVNTYCVETTDNETYVLTFSIPDNCDYRIWTDGIIHYVVVQLKPDETRPSSKYIPCSESIITKGVLAIDFDQQDCDDENANLQKPKIRIEF